MKVPAKIRVGFTAGSVREWDSTADLAGGLWEGSRVGTDMGQSPRAGL